MKILVLGGAGLQGKAVLHDLSRSPQVKEVICADITFEPLARIEKFLDMNKIKLEKLDVQNQKALLAMMKDRVDAVIDVLPVAFINNVAEAALEARVHVVNTMYGSQMGKGLDEKAKEKNITILPEMGCDPGIDLVLCGYGVSQMDEVFELHSYCGGFPEPKAADNPFQYKITWTWNGVLLSYKRGARSLKDGRVIDIPPRDQHAKQWIEVIDFPGVGQLELIPNGDALKFAEALGLMKTLRSTSRCMMRWPGHSDLWKKLYDLNFLSDDPVPGLPFSLTPHQFMIKHLEPQLQYKEGERDIVAMRNIIGGRKGGQKIKITFDMLDMWDLETGLFAMNRTVGYTASIAAQMIVNGEIKRRGLLTSVRDVPYKRFLEELGKRGIVIREQKESS